MEKRTIRKEDGRYLIFYGFERPIPPVIDEKKSAEAKRAAGGSPSSKSGKGEEA